MKLVTVVRCLLNFILLPSVLMISGCALHDDRPIIIKPETTPQDYRMLTAQQMIKQLRSQDIGIIITGESVRIIIASNKLFNNRSANLNWEAPHLLASIAKLLQQYEIISMRIGGYANYEQNEKLNWALSKRQAEVIVSELNAQGLDTRLLYAVGNGLHYPLINSSNMVINNRIEISFQYVPMSMSVRAKP